MAERRGAGQAADAVLSGARAVRGYRSRLLPRGPLDPLIQFALIAAAYYGWRYARGAVDGNTAVTMAGAFAHSRELIDVERSLGMLFEPSVQSWAIHAGWPSEFARWGYQNLHFKGSCLALIAVYFWRPASFPFLRNMVIAAMAISVAGYAFFATAPPRFIPEMGLDPSGAVTGNGTLELHSANALYNPFAAVPSMHVGLSIVFFWTMALLTRFRPLKVILFAYPFLMTYVVIATGNHFWLDALLGAVTAGLSAGVAILLGRLHPAWALHPAPARRRAGAIEPEPEPEAATA